MAASKRTAFTSSVRLLELKETTTPKCTYKQLLYCKGVIDTMNYDSGSLDPCWLLPLSIKSERAAPSHIVVTDDPTAV